MNLCEYEDCTGCMSCLNACKKGAISVFSDEQGFLRPKIDENICIECGLCRTVCPQLSYQCVSDFKKKIYAAWNYENKVRKNSSSGGIFSALAEQIFLQGGVVFGVVFDENLDVVHKAVDNCNDLEKIRGSKYVQSNINSTFSEIKKFLKEGKTVLFSGTPCQVAGLYSFLRKRYKNLITVDLACHGVPSPLVYRDFLRYIGKKYNSEVTGVCFRDKSSSWKSYDVRITLKNGDIYRCGFIDDPFMLLFLKNFCLRPSCYKCRYSNLNRLGDLTLADFWGYKETYSEDIDDDMGISALIINSQAGDKLFQSIKHKIKYFEREEKDISRENLNFLRPSPIPKNYEDFWSDYKIKSFDKIVKKYLHEKKHKSQNLDLHTYFINLSHNVSHIPNKFFIRVLGESKYNKLKENLKHKK